MSAILFDTQGYPLPTIVNAAFGLVIAVRLMFFRRLPGSSFKRWAGWLAYVLIVFYASYPIRLLFGHPVNESWVWVVGNGLLCVSVLRARGNVVSLVRSSR